MTTRYTASTRPRKATCSWARRSACCATTARATVSPPFPSSRACSSPTSPKTPPATCGWPPMPTDSSATIPRQVRSCAATPMPPAIRERCRATRCSRSSATASAVSGQQRSARDSASTMNRTTISWFTTKRCSGRETCRATSTTGSSRTTAATSGSPPTKG